MVTTTIHNTAGAVIATIPVSGINDTAAPVTLVGQGISLYGAYVMEDLVKLCEHFANVTPPANAIPGTIWYDSTTTRKRANLYDGTNWIPLVGSNATSGFMFSRLAGADNISFAATGATAIFTAPGTSEKFHPTGVMLIPHGTPTSTDPATFNLYVSSSEDVMENTIVAGYATNKHAYFTIGGSTRFASGTDSIYLEVTSPVTSGTLAFDAYLFGFVRV